LEDGRPHLNLTLRAEILYYTTLGIARSVLKASKCPVADRRRLRRGKPPMYFNRLNLSRIHEERGLFTLQKKKQDSSCEGADCAGGVGLGFPLLSTTEQEDSSSSWAASEGENDDSFLLRIARRPSMLDEGGGDDGASLGTDSSDSEGGEGGGTVDAEPYLPNSIFGLLGSLLAQKHNFVFHDFEPHTFMRLRELDGITLSDYLRALSSTQKERFSEGHSGAFLYFSSCNRFIVKTLRHSEMETLLRMLAGYERHLSSNPNSLLTRFYGCHALSMYGTTLYFAVMKVRCVLLLPADFPPFFPLSLPAFFFNLTPRPQILLCITLPCLPLIKPHSTECPHFSRLPDSRALRLEGLLD
jgi:hypothetical protein